MPDDGLEAGLRLRKEVARDPGSLGDVHKEAESLEFLEPFSSLRLSALLRRSLSLLDVSLLALVRPPALSLRWVPHLYLLELLLTVNLFHCNRFLHGIRGWLLISNRSLLLLLRPIGAALRLLAALGVFFHCLQEHPVQLHEIMEDSLLL